MAAPVPPAYIRAMTRPALPISPGLALAAFSAAMLAAALGFEHLGGLAPCVLCMDQRYAHLAALVAGLAAAATSGGMAGRIFLALGLGALVAGAGIAIFHVGVEQHWWRGTEACGSALAASGDVDALLAQIQAAPVVRCDAVAWSLFGISMAGWNALASLAAAGILAFVADWRAAADRTGMA